MRVTNRIMVVLAFLLLGLFTIQSFAQSSNANPRAFGIGQPQNATDLPPGIFRTRLQSLPPQARGKAMQVLQAFTFPELDLEYMRIDEWGGVYYADTYVPELVESNEEPLILPEAISASETFLLHSRPGASRVVYLDFDGHIISGTAWNGGNDNIADPLYATAYNSSNDDTMVTDCDRGAGIEPVYTVNFSTTELARIGEIWHRVAEDLAPWDIDVTTQLPGSFNSTTGRLLFTDDSDYCGDAMPAQGAGGVAYVVVFGNGNYHTWTSPALVYWTNLGSGAATSNHEAASHEFGHNLGLAHDGNSSSSYYTGHGSSDSSPVDLNSWAPIMGVGYYRNVTQWSKGDYPDAVRSSNYQPDADDLAVITSKLTYRTDDHGDTIGTATGLTIQGNGTIAVTNPEDDPHEFSSENKGVIEDRTDLDFFYFDTAAGLVNFTIEPAWAAFYRSTTRRGANLDIEAKLMDGSGSIIDSSDPLDDTNAALSATVAAGRYYLSIDGVGNPGNTNDSNNENYGYDDYASLGMYFISGSVQPTSNDSDGPTPSTMTWAVNPYSISSSSIGMTATTAVDISLPIEYNFACVSGGAGCTQSGWQTGTSYTATGLDANTTYEFTVQARDAIPNLNTASAPSSATTDLPPPNAPSSFSAAAVSQTQIDLAWVDNSSNEDGFNLRRTTDQLNWFNLPNQVANTTAYNDNNSGSGLTAGTQYFYEIRSFSNVNGDSAWVSANATTLEDAPDGTPTDLAATAISSSQIDLSWTDGAGNASSFEIERSADGSSGWSNIGSVDPEIEAYSDTGLASATTWYYRVGAFTTGGINFSDVVSAMTDFECSASKPVPANQWMTFSIPCAPGNSRVDSAFGSGLLPADYEVSWVVFIYDNAIGGGTPGYRRLLATDTLVAGQGYFFYSTVATTMSMEGTNHPLNDIPLRTEWTEGAYNLVGNPHNGDVSWADVKVINNGQVLDLAAADDLKNGNYACNSVPPPNGNKCYMSHEMNQWKLDHYEPFDGLGQTVGTLKSFDAMWVRAHKSGIELQIPTPQGAPPVNQSLAISSASTTTNESRAASSSDHGNKGDGKKGGGKKGKAGDPWYVRLVAESGSHRDDGNWLGQLSGAKDGLDHRDLEEWTPYSDPHLSILFTNPLFDTVDWGYTTDYRELTATPQGEWPFVVRASDGITEVTLTWEGDTDLFDNAILIDEVSGETITVVPGDSYTFSISGGEHAFRLVFK